MGANCTRADCAVIGLWYDCACANHLGPAGISASRDRDWEPTEFLPTQELEVQLVCDKFAIRKIATQGARSDWRRKYVLGRELGAGQTAIVFEAFAVAPSVEESLGAWPVAAGRLPESPLDQKLDNYGSTAAQAAGLAAAQVAAHAAVQAVAQRRNAVPTIGRRVALKRFNTAGTTMFQHELQAFSAVGTHPHILRLLESYEGGNGEDILVLEHCDGGDLYELYAANHGCCMLEACVIQLLRQLLLALQHLMDRGVEHRDIKPENLLLYYGSPKDTAAIPHLKLADFGWAVVLRTMQHSAPVPLEGVGSLWYAPPELNPPAEGVQKVKSVPSPGRSDMWSVGIITYLLLIGHSPFNLALRIADPAVQEAEVIRLAGMGKFNTSTRPWACLSEEARHFVGLLIQPDPARRLTPAEAWNHPFVARSHNGSADALGAQPYPSSQVFGPDRTERWGQLDGLQRLSWMAIARAIAEPEMVDIPVLETFINQQSMGSTLYLEQLAVELAAVASTSWFQPKSAWADVLLLAFNYLDGDTDGVLGVGDLAHHLVGEEARECAEAWVSKWRLPYEGTHRSSCHGLCFIEFHRALLMAQLGQQ